MKAVKFQKFSAALGRHTGVIGTTELIFVRGSDKGVQYATAAIVAFTWATKCANL
jgi:hypothetical protein